MSAAKYFITGNENGPFTRENLLTMLAKGEVQATDLYWSEGMLDWLPIGYLAKITSTDSTICKAEPTLEQETRMNRDILRGVIVLFLFGGVCAAPSITAAGLWDKLLPLAVCQAFCWIPMWHARRMRHPHLQAICVLAMATSWIFFGLVAATVWSMVKPRPTG